MGFKTPECIYDTIRIHDEDISQLRRWGNIVNDVGENPFAKAVPSDKCGSQGKTKMALEIDETGLVMIKWNDVWICPWHCSHIEKNVEFSWKNIILFLAKFCTIWNKECYESLTWLSHNSVWFCFSKQLKRDLDDTFKKGSWDREQF